MKNENQNKNARGNGEGRNLQSTGRFPCVSIIGQIEGHYLVQDGQKATTYEEILPLLVSFEEDDDVRGVLFLLNTMGGDVEAGMALSELIASLSKPTVSLVLGGGHSSGSPSLLG